MTDPKSGPPFERHKTYYLLLKLAVLALAALVGPRLVGAL